MWVLSVLYAIYWIGRRSSSIIQKNLPNMADKSDKDASDWLPNPKSRTDMQFHDIIVEKSGKTAELLNEQSENSIGQFLRSMNSLQGSAMGFNCKCRKILPSWIEAIKAFLTTEDTMQQAVEIGLVDECMSLWSSFNWSNLVNKPPSLWASSQNFPQEYRFLMK
ncbi:hypothetical protein SDJN03_22504, partial [Cucurbita argyrosperma subsp. sororia]